MIEFKHDDDVAEIINRCQDLINEYQKYELLPDRLKFIEKKLSGYFSYLIRRKAEAQGIQNFHYWVRKVSHSRESIKARKSSSSQVQADHIANEKILQEIKDETYSVWRFEDLSGFCKALEKIFVSISHQLKDYQQERINQR
jgi:hypothetical protein